MSEFPVRYDVDLMKHSRRALSVVTRGQFSLRASQHMYDLAAESGAQFILWTDDGRCPVEVDTPCATQCEGGTASRVHLLSPATRLYVSARPHDELSFHSASKFVRTDGDRFENPVQLPIRELA